MATHKPKPAPVEERLELRYVPLSQCLKWDWEANPKKHDMGGIIQSIEKHGFIDAPKYDAKLDAFVYGNGRAQAVGEMKANGYERPRGIVADEAGEWLLPVKFGVDAASVREATAAGISHNNLTLSGGDFGPLEMQRLWDETAYAGLLADLAAHDELPVGIDDEDVDALIGQLSGEGKDYDSFSQNQELIGKRGDDEKPTYGVLVVCEGEGEQAEQFQRLKDEGYNCVLQGAKPPGVKR